MSNAESLRSLYARRRRLRARLKDLGPLLRGSVVDFISVGEFPVFNVADSSITVGASLLLLSMWLSERNQEGGEDEADGDK